MSAGTRVGRSAALHAAVAALAALLALALLPGCRGCQRGEDERTQAGASAPHDDAQTARTDPDAAPSTDATRPSDDGTDADAAPGAASRAGSLCYLMHHYGPLPASLETLSGDAEARCEALQAELDDAGQAWSCDELCATARALGADTVLPRSLSWRLGEPAERALAFGPRSVRLASAPGLAGAPQLLAELDEAGAFVDPEGGAAAIVAALEGDDSSRVALALAPEVSLRTALELVPIAAGPRAIELLIAPAAELAESGTALAADALARHGALELALTDQRPDDDDVLLAVSAEGYQLGTAQGLRAFDGADCESATTLCLLPDLSDSQPWPLLDRLDQGGLDRALSALAPGESTRLWLWVAPGVPAGAVVRALDVARHRWPQPPGMPWVPPGAVPERAATNEPLERFSDPVVYVHGPLPASVGEALPSPPEADAAVQGGDGGGGGVLDSFEASAGADKAAIQSVMGAQVPVIDACHAAQAAGAVDLVVMHLSIGADGHVLAARVDATGQPAFEACVLEALEALVFEPPRGGAPIEVRYPLSFGAHE